MCVCECVFTVCVCVCVCVHGVCVCVFTVCVCVFTVCVFTVCVCVCVHGVCVCVCVCVCVHGVCVHLGWGKCRAQIQSKGRHTWSYVTSLLISCNADIPKLFVILNLSNIYVCFKYP